MQVDTSSPPVVNPGFLTRRQAARYLQVSERTLSDWQRRRLLPFVKVGARCVRFRRHDLDEAMRALTVESVDGGRP
jgi:excisionase family DNA binding protein